MGGSALNTGVTLTNGTSYYATQTENGCESASRLEVSVIVINNPDTSVILNGNIITANAIGADYQWVDCLNGNMLISGEANQSYTVATNGSYAVIVTLNGCSDTSSCVDINGIGVSEYSEASLKFIVYPNPTEGVFKIENLGAKIEKIELYNLLGEMVYHEFIYNFNKEVILNISSQPSGIYFLNCKSENEEQILKIIKQ
jgi:PKD repeat protein